LRHKGIETPAIATKMDLSKITEVARPSLPAPRPRGTLANVTRRLSRLPVAAVLLFLSSDLVDGPTPGPSVTGVLGAPVRPALEGSSAEAHDAEFFCARATVVGPARLTADAAALPQRLIAPKTRRPALGFLTPLFHPPRRAL